MPTHKLLLRVLASIDAPKYKHCHNPGHYEISSIDVTHSNVFPLSLFSETEWSNKCILSCVYRDELCGNTTSSPLMEVLTSSHSQDPTIASVDGPGNEGTVRGFV